MNCEPLIPLRRWLETAWPVTDRTARRYELDPDDPLPVVRINRRKYLRASEGEAWLRRRAAREAAKAQRQTDEIIEEARTTGRSMDALYAERRAG